MLTCGTIFSGGGGYDIGTKQAGFMPIWGIEYDRKLADLYRLNFGHDPYQDLLAADPRNYDRVDLLHLSPPCVNFSKAKSNAIELDVDRQLADKCCEFIEYLQPQFVTIENVPQYLHSNSYSFLVNCLKRQGYLVVNDFVDAANFGAATNRLRLIIRASKYPMGMLAESHNRRQVNTLFGVRESWISWHDAIADLFDDLPDSQLTINQLRAISQSFWRDGDYLIQRVGYRNSRGALIRPIHMPCWTLIASLGGDRRSGNRNHVINAVVGDRVKSLNARALARIQSFPDLYQLPPDLGASTLYRAIGNSVAPKVAEAICHSLIGSASQSIDLASVTIGV